MMSTGEDEYGNAMFKPYRGVLPTWFQLLDYNVRNLFLTMELMRQQVLNMII